MPASRDTIQLWLLALEHDLGVCIHTHNAETLQQLKTALYVARRDHPNLTAIRDIEVRTSPRAPQTELWLVRKQEPAPLTDLTALTEG